jgi:hypothetical protein
MSKTIVITGASSGFGALTDGYGPDRPKRRWPTGMQLRGPAAGPGGPQPRMKRARVSRRAGILPIVQRRCLRLTPASAT